MGGLDAAVPAALPTLDDLEDGLLSDILVLAGEDERPSTSLVSKRWRRLVFSEPRFWENLVVAVPDSMQQQQPGACATWLAGKRTLLGRVGPLVQRFGVAGILDLGGSIPPGASDAPLCSLLELLNPATLESVVIVALTAEGEGQPTAVGPLEDVAVLALARFTRLSQLLLQGTMLGPRQAEAVGRLHSLRNLRIDMDVAGGVADALCGLQQLRVLEVVASTCDLRLSTLTALRHLEKVEVTHFGWEVQSVVELPRLACFPRLRQCIASAGGHAHLEVAGTQLRAIILGVPCPAPHVVGQPSRAADADAHLLLDGCAILSLPELAAVLLPPAAAQPGLHLLELIDCALEAAALGGDGDVLSRTCGLDLVCCFSPAQEAEQVAEEAEERVLSTAALDAALRRMPLLHRLVVTGCCLDGVLPPSLTNSTRIRTLALSNVDLRSHELTEGCYLEGLHELHLGSNTNLVTLPPALASATALRSLALGGSPLLLEEADWDRFCSRMPHLTELVLGLGILEHSPTPLQPPDHLISLLPVPRELGVWCASEEQAPSRF